MEPTAIERRQDRAREMRAIQDSMNILSRKWTITILSAIYYHKSQRFTDLRKDTDGISNKQLSKELKLLELDYLVKRTVIGKHPWYELTEHGRTLKPVIENLTAWGRKSPTH